MEQVSAFGGGSEVVNVCPLVRLLLVALPIWPLATRAKNTGADGPQWSIPGIALFAADNRPAERLKAG